VRALGKKKWPWGRFWGRDFRERMRKFGPVEESLRVLKANPTFTEIYLGVTPKRDRQAEGGLQESINETPTRLESGDTRK